MINTLFGFAVVTPILLRARCIRSHGKIGVWETRGPKRSLYLSVAHNWDVERQCWNGLRYVIRRGLYGGVRGDFEVLNLVVRA